MRGQYSAIFRGLFERNIQEYSIFYVRESLNLSALIIQTGKKSVK
jgi:hypothetical protein